MRINIRGYYITCEEMMLYQRVYTYVKLIALYLCRRYVSVQKEMIGANGLSQ